MIEASSKTISPLLPAAGGSGRHQNTGSASLRIITWGAAATCREMGFLGQLPAWLAAPSNDSGRSGTAMQPVSRQKAANLLCVLETLMLMLRPPPEAHGRSGSVAGDGARASEGRGAAAAAQLPSGPRHQSRAASQAVLMKQGALEPLLALGLDGDGAVPVSVRVQVGRPRGLLIGHCG